MSCSSVRPPRADVKGREAAEEQSGGVACVGVCVLRGAKALTACTSWPPCQPFPPAPRAQHLELARYRPSLRPGCTPPAPSWLTHVEAGTLQHPW